MVEPSPTGPAPTLVAAARLGGAGAPPDDPPAEPDVESDPQAVRTSAALVQVARTVMGRVVIRIR